MSDMKTRTDVLIAGLTLAQVEELFELLDEGFSLSLYESVGERIKRERPEFFEEG